MKFPFGIAYFQGQTVSFREGMQYFSFFFLSEEKSDFLFELKAGASCETFFGYILLESYTKVIHFKKDLYVIALV